MSTLCRNGLKFKVLYSNQHIQKVVIQMAHKIDQYYHQLSQKQGPIDLVVICVLKGAFMFYTDLVKHIRHPHNNQFIRVRSYEGTHSTGKLQFTEQLKEEVYRDKHLLLIDDIHDTGRTIEGLINRLGQMKPKTIDVAVLVVRPDKPIKLDIKFRGLECSNFILGYGLDLDEWGRNLPDIYQKIDQ